MQPGWEDVRMCLVKMTGGFRDRTYFWWFVVVAVGWLVWFEFFLLVFFFWGGWGAGKKQMPDQAKHLFKM